MSRAVIGCLVLWRGRGARERQRAGRRRGEAHTDALGRHRWRWVHDREPLVLVAPGRDHANVAAQTADPGSLLGRNRLTSIDGVERCAALVELEVGANRIARVPTAIGRLASLRKLDLSGNPIAELPASLVELAALEELILGGCPITRLPDDLGRLTRLRRILVTNTRLPLEEHARLRTALQEAEIIGGPKA